MHKDAYSDDRMEDENVIADNREIMLIRCLVIEPGTEVGSQCEKKVQVTIEAAPKVKRDEKEKKCGREMESRKGNNWR